MLISLRLISLAVMPLLSAATLFFAIFIKPAMLRALRYKDMLMMLLYVSLLIFFSLRHITFFSKRLPLPPFRRRRFSPYVIY